MNTAYMNEWEQLKITVKKGNENREHIIEDMGDKKEFFYKSYQAVFVALDKITIASEKCLALIESNRRNTINGVMYSELLKYSNNIILFSAERGAGKTSAMLSVGEFLSQVEQHKKENSALFKKKFKVLPVIDPTAMETQESILKIIISRMFIVFKEKWSECKENGNAEDYTEQKEKLIKLFQECFKHIDIISQHRVMEETYDDLYYLADLGDSTNLKITLYRLVQQFLKFISDGADVKGNYLVLQIDDVDLNTKHVYKVLEDLRKYFSLPNVILLMAADVEQLRRVLLLNYVTEYNVLLNVDDSYIKKYQEMAEKYIEKMFPFTYQVHLPQIDASICQEESRLSVEYIGEDGTNLLEFIDSNGMQVKDFQEILLRLIYEKTGLIITKKSYLHELLPQKMRTLTHFLEYMDSMETIDLQMNWMESLRVCFCGDSTEKEKEKFCIENKKRYDNLKKFEKYLCDFWAPFHLNDEQLGILRQIQKESLSNKADVLLSCMQQYFDGIALTTNPGRGIAKLEYELNKAVSREEEKENRKFYTLILTYLSVYKNEIALYDLTQNEYVISLRKLYGKRYIECPDGEKGIISPIFKIDYRKFVTGIKQYIADGMNNRFVQLYRDYFLRTDLLQQEYFDIFGIFSMYGKRDMSIMTVDEEMQNSALEIGLSIAQIVLNNDLIRIVQEQFNDKVVMDKENQMITPTQMLKKIYEGIDDAIKSNSYLNLSSNITSIITRESTHSNAIITLAFICNDDIANLYFELMKKKLEKAIPSSIVLKDKEIIGKMSEISQQLQGNMESIIRKTTDLGFDNIVQINERIKKLFDVNTEYLQKYDEIVREVENIFKKLNLEEQNTEKDKEVTQLCHECNEIIKKWRDAIDKI